MCGRFMLTTELDRLLAFFRIGHLEENGEARYPRYNIAPSQKVLIAVSDGERKRAGWVRWGLVPFWAKDPSVGAKMINARAETAAVKPSFRQAFKQRRCWVLADGFYEWKREGRQKQPYCIRLKDEVPFAMAGLWDRWKSPQGEEWVTCTILTTTPNELMKPIHDRMPVILDTECARMWLDPSVRDTESLQALLTPFDSKEMEAYPVSSQVNNPRNDDADCIRPLPEA